MLPLDRATDGDTEATTVATADTNMYKIQFNSTCLDAPLQQESGNRILHTT